MPILAEPARMARPGDYDGIAAVADQWWNRPILGSLPRLFLDHFYQAPLAFSAAQMI
jgi:hypothetical protein